MSRLASAQTTWPQADRDGRPSGPRFQSDQRSRAELAARVRRLAWWLDNSFELPVIGYRVGLDGLLGLIPGVGDVATAFISGWLIREAHRAGAPPALLARMAVNVAIDTLLGIVPGAGDLFDMAFKANARNARLLSEHLEGPGPAPHGWVSVNGTSEVAPRD